MKKLVLIAALLLSSNAFAGYEESADEETIDSVNQSLKSSGAAVLCTRSNANEELVGTKLNRLLQRVEKPFKASAPTIAGLTGTSPRGIRKSE